MWLKKIIKPVEEMNDGDIVRMVGIGLLISIILLSVSQIIHN